MTKIEVIHTIISYLKEHNIYFQKYISLNGERSIVFKLSGYHRCPDRTLECSIYFFKTWLEAMVYYTANASHWIADRPERLPDIYRLLNFISASVWPFKNDGVGGALCSSHHLNTPRFYITEDGHNDLTSTTVIDYNIYAMTPIETAEYITAAIPELMDELSIPLFYVLLNKMTTEEAIYYIKKEIIEKTG